MSAKTLTLSHNACSVYCCVPRLNVSYWIEIDRGDFTCTDIVGEFSIIDPSFQVETYGTHLIGDLSFVKNYSVRRCFAEIMDRLPSYLEGVPCSFSVLNSRIDSSSDLATIYSCRCYFNPLRGEPIGSIDFRLSLGIERLGANKNRKDTQR